CLMQQIDSVLRFRSEFPGYAELAACWWLILLREGDRGCRHERGCGQRCDCDDLPPPTHDANSPVTGGQACLICILHLRRDGALRAGRLLGLGLTATSTYIFARAASAASSPTSLGTFFQMSVDNWRSVATSPISAGANLTLIAFIHGLTVSVRASCAQALSL